MKGQITLGLGELKEILAKHFNFDIKSISVETIDTSTYATNMGKIIAEFSHQEQVINIRF